MATFEDAMQAVVAKVITEGAEVKRLRDPHGTERLAGSLTVREVRLDTDHFVPGGGGTYGAETHESSYERCIEVDVVGTEGHGTIRWSGTFAQALSEIATAAVADGVFHRESGSTIAS